MYPCPALPFCRPVALKNKDVIISQQFFGGFKARIMRKILYIFLFLLSLSPPAFSEGTHLRDLKVTRNGDDLYVSVRLDLDQEMTRELKKGIEKKVIFYVDLFRAWYKWPDEFVLGKKVERDLKCDNVKGEYLVTELNRGSSITKRFENCEDLLSYALSVNNARLVDTKEIEHSRYLVKVTAESRLRNLPPLIGQMFFFIKDIEFSVRTKSPVMKIGGGK